VVPKGPFACSQGPALDHVMDQVNLVCTFKPYSLRSILIISSYLYLGLQSGFFPSGFLTWGNQCNSIIQVLKGHRNSGEHNQLVKLWPLFFGMGRWVPCGLLSHRVHSKLKSVSGHIKKTEKFHLTHVPHNRNVSSVAPLCCDNAKIHRSFCTNEAITNFRWTMTLHPPYSLDLILSDYHLYGPLKEGLYNDNMLITAAVWHGGRLLQSSCSVVEENFRNIRTMIKNKYNFGKIWT